MICRYRGCPSTRVKNPTLSFFYFPKDEVHREAWLARSGNERLCGSSPEELKSRAFRLCGLHFEDRDFKNELKKKASTGMRSPRSMIPLPNLSKALQKLGAMEAATVT
jgi:hypothetical protein